MCVCVCTNVIFSSSQTVFQPRDGSLFVILKKSCTDRKCFRIEHPDFTLEVTRWPFHNSISLFIYFLLLLGFNYSDNSFASSPEALALRERFFFSTGSSAVEKLLCRFHSQHFWRQHEIHWGWLFVWTSSIKCWVAVQCAGKTWRAHFQGATVPVAQCAEKPVRCDYIFSLVAPVHLGFSWSFSSYLLFLFTVIQ